MRKHLFHFTTPAILLIIFLVSGAPFAFAYIASSSNYRLQTDSVNAGGTLSTSTSYTVEDTVGESGVGSAGSATYQVKAGYQQMQEVYLAVSLSGDVTLLPNIPSTGGGVANGTASFTVTTDNQAGYTMNIRASTTPALASGINNFPDYVPAGANPDLTFITPGASSRFGYSPEGAHILQKFKDNGLACNIGASDAVNACWLGLSTTPETIASSAISNHPGGTQTSVKFRASSDVANVQAGGLYSATTTVTIMAL